MGSFAVDLANEGEPVTILVGVDRQAEAAQGVFDLGCPLGNHPTDDQSATGAQTIDEARSELQDHPGDDVRDDDIEFLLDRWAIDASFSDLNPRCQAVRSHVLPRGSDGDWIDVDGDHAASAEPDRGNSQDTRASSDVEDLVSGANDRLEELEAPASRRMEARPEGGTGVQGDQDVARLWLIVEPGRANDDPLANAKGMVMRFPGARPVFLGYLANIELTDWPDRPKMPKRFFDLPLLVFRALVDWNITAHGRAATKDDAVVCTGN